jgi:hypothetical protein
MAYLSNLSVKKISFVNRAANKRTFTLLKADKSLSSDSVEVIKATGDIVVKDDIIEKTKGSETMPEVIKAEEKSVVAAATTDVVVKVEEPVADAPIIKTEVIKAEDGEKDVMEKAELLAENKKLSDRLAKIERDQRRRDTISWLKSECSFLQAEIEKTADELLKLEDISVDAASTMKDSLKKMSATVQNSPIFKESGSTTDALIRAESNGFDLIRKVSADLDTIKKSDAGGSKKLDAATIANIIRNHSDGYEMYRESHIRRAATRGMSS